MCEPVHRHKCGEGEGQANSALSSETGAGLSHDPEIMTWPNQEWEAQPTEPPRDS